MPDFLKKYFWDVDFSRLDHKKHSEYVIERLLELGDIKAVKWVFRNFATLAIKNVLLRSSNLSEKSAIYWSNILDVPKVRVRCLQSEFQKTHKVIWPY